MKIYDNWTLDSVLVLLEILDSEFVGTADESKLVSETLNLVGNHIVKMKKS